MDDQKTMVVSVHAKDCVDYQCRRCGQCCRHIKEAVMGRLDHQNLNEVLHFNPTAENIAHWICEQIPFCFKVEVRESEGNTVIYEKD